MKTSHRGLNIRRDNGGRSEIWKRFGSRFDSWVNTLTGIGVSGLDKMVATSFSASAILTDQQLENLYNGDDLAARIVDAVVDEALREGYELLIGSEGDTDEAKEQGIAVRTFLEQELDATSKLGDSWAWGRLFGGGAIYMVTNDGAESRQDEPLELERVETIDALTVLDKRDLTPWAYYDDETEPKFGEVKTFKVNSTGPTATSAGQLSDVEIHETRLLMFGGVRTTNRTRQTNQGYSLSVLQRVFDTLKQFNLSWASLANMLQSASQGVFSMEGLIEMIAAGEQETMQRRMALVDIQRSVARSLIIDAEREKFEQVAMQFSGVPETMRVFMNRIAAAARMPLTVLMGMSPAGMNATGESDRVIWAQTVKTEQIRVLKPQLRRLVDVVLHASNGPTNGQVPDEWDIVFPPLLEMSQEQEAAIRKTVAESDAIYIDRGVLLPEEVAINRFTGDYSMETQVDTEDRQKILEADMARDLEQADEPDPPSITEPEVPEPEPEAEPVDPEAVDPTTALNGAQVKALQELVISIADGTLPKRTVILMISAAFPISEVDAARIVADVEEPDADDTPPAPPQNPPPFGSPPSPDQDDQEPVPPPPPPEAPPGDDDDEPED